MEDFAVGDREHAQTPEGARGRGQGLLRGGAETEVGAICQAEEDHNSKADLRRLDRTRNPGGEVARDHWGQRGGLSRPAEGAGLKPGTGRETRDLSQLGGGASRRQIHGCLCPSYPETHKHFPRSEAPALSGPRGGAADGRFPVLRWRLATQRPFRILDSHS